MKSIKELLEFSILNIDKPSGPTSFGTDTKIKNWLNLRKVSHFGTLDPKVTGVLPVALNRACKLSEFFMHKDKSYIGIMILHSDVTKDKLKTEMEKFIGEITQLPPKKSKVKRAERKRSINKFEIIEKNKREILFFSEVQAGTYIRKLIHDLGEKIGGAHMKELRRTKAGIFEEIDTISLYKLKEAIDNWKKGDETEIRKMLIPAEDAIKKVLTEFQIKEKPVKNLLTGKPLMKQDIDNSKQIKEGRFALFHKDQFIGVYKKTNEKEIIARPEFVLQPI